MATRLNCTRIFITGTSFLGAIALGYIVTSARSKTRDQWVTDHVTETADWIDSKGRETIAKSVHQMQQIRSNVRRRVNHHVPDLYEATEQIHLSRPEIHDA